MKNKLKTERDGIDAELADMVFQFILLLNAGLVESQAFKRLCEMNSDDPCILYLRFNEIRKHSEASNSSVIHDVYEFARYSGSRSFVRFASLLVQSCDRGSELSEKLDRERVHLWQEKLSYAKAKAKEADTKLSFPLMLLLVSLILVTISPALLTM